MQWYLTTLKKYALFNGRARRMEWGAFFLFSFLFLIITAVLDLVIYFAFKEPMLSFVSILFVMVIITPALAVTVRRLHDIGENAWTLLSLCAIPILGWIRLLDLLLTDGYPGKNQFGVNSKGNAEE